MNNFSIFLIWMRDAYEFEFYFPTSVNLLPIFFSFFYWIIQHNLDSVLLHDNQMLCYYHKPLRTKVLCSVFFILSVRAFNALILDFLVIRFLIASLHYWKQRIIFFWRILLQVPLRTIFTKWIIVNSHKPVQRKFLKPVFIWPG